MQRMGLPGAGHHPPPHHRRPPTRDGARRDRLPAPVQGPLVRLHQDADPGGVADEPGHHGVAELLRRHPHRPPGRPATACTSCRWASTRSCSARSPTSQRIPGRLITTASADVTMKGLKYLLEALAKLRTEREVSPGRHRPQEGGRRRRPARSTSWACGDCVEFVTGVPEERIIELYSEAEVAVVPSLYEGFSLPAIEAMSCGVPLVATTGGALPEVVGADNDTALLVPPGDSEALAARIATALDDPELRARIGAAGRQRVIDRWTWRHTAVGTVEHYRALLAETAHIQGRRPGGALAAPRFRAGTRPPARAATDRPRWPDRCSPSTTTSSASARATCCSTWAAASAATPSRACRRGARVVACDMALDELRRDPQPVRGHGHRRARSPADSRGDVRQRRRHPPAVPRRHLRPHHRQRGDGAHPRRPGRARRADPGAQARAARSPSPSRPGCPRRSAGRLSDEYHAPVRRGRPRAHLHRGRAAPKMRGAGLRRRRRPPRPRPALALLVAEVRGRAHQRRLPAGEARTTGCWCGTSTQDSRRSPASPSSCSTRCWARAWWSTPPSRIARRAGTGTAATDARRPRCRPLDVTVGRPLDATA